MKHSKPQIVWNIKQSQVTIEDLTITVIPPRLAPGNIDAVVEEQDTALVLGEPSTITAPEKTPGWALANMLENQVLNEPGSIVIHKGKTTRFLAIVHDLEQEPTWKAEWVIQSLEKLFSLSVEYNIKNIQIPVLGAQHGRFPFTSFIDALFERIHINPGAIKEIWLVTPPEDCAEILSYIKKYSNY